MTRIKILLHLMRETLIFLLLIPLAIPFVLLFLLLRLLYPDHFRQGIEEARRDIDSGQ